MKFFRVNSVAACWNSQLPQVQGFLLGRRVMSGLGSTIGGVGAGVWVRQSVGSGQGHSGQRSGGRVRDTIIAGVLIYDNDIYLLGWCSGYHVSFTRCRSWVRNPYRVLLQNRSRSAEVPSGISSFVDVLSSETPIKQ
jgi:hypothetical protein